MVQTLFSAPIAAHQNDLPPATAIAWYLVAPSTPFHMTRRPCATFITETPPGTPGLSPVPPPIASVVTSELPAAAVFAQMVYLVPAAPASKTHSSGVADDRISQELPAGTDFTV